MPAQALVPNTARPIAILVKSLEFSWGSSLPDKPSILIQGAAKAPGKIFAFSAAWRQGAGQLTVRPVGVHLPPAVVAAVTASLAGPSQRAWQEARRFTDHTLDHGLIRGTRLRVSSLILSGEGYSGYLSRTNLEAYGAFAQVHGISGTFGITPSGRVSLGWLTPPLPAGPHDPFAIVINQQMAAPGRGMHDQSRAKEILSVYIGGTQALAIVDALVATGPVVIAFGRQIAGLLPMVG